MQYSSFKMAYQLTAGEEVRYNGTWSQIASIEAKPRAPRQGVYTFRLADGRAMILAATTWVGYEIEDSGVERFGECLLGQDREHLKPLATPEEAAQNLENLRAMGWGGTRAGAGRPVEVERRSEEYQKGYNAGTKARQRKQQRERE